MVGTIPRHGKGGGILDGILGKAASLAWQGTSLTALAPAPGTAPLLMLP